jgi:hypothetical protein
MENEATAEATMALVAYLSNSLAALRRRLFWASVFIAALDVVSTFVIAFIATVIIAIAVLLVTIIVLLLVVIIIVVVVVIIGVVEVFIVFFIPRIGAKTLTPLRPWSVLNLFARLYFRVIVSGVLPIRRPVTHGGTGVFRRKRRRLKKAREGKDMGLCQQRGGIK